MRYPLLAATLAALLAAPAAAQIHGALSDARVLPLNGRMGGVYLQLDEESTTLQGQLRQSFHPNLDFGFQGGLSRITDGTTRTSVRLGGDFRGQLATQAADFPFTLSLGGAIGMESADDRTVLAIGPQVVLSRALGGAERWIAYGGAALLFSRYDAGAGLEVDTSFPVRVGIEYVPNPDVRLLLEGQVGVSDEIRKEPALTLGILLPF